MSARVLKTTFNKDIRRVGVSSDITFAQLLDLLASRYGVSQLKVAYVDEDNDVITIGSDEELREAFRLCPAPNALRIFVSQAGDVLPGVLSASSSVAGSLRAVQPQQQQQEEQREYDMVEDEKEVLQRVSSASSSASSSEDDSDESDVEQQAPPLAASASPASPSVVATPHQDFTSLFHAVLPLIYQAHEQHTPRVTAAMQDTMQKTISALSGAAVEFAQAMQAERQQAEDYAAQQRAAQQQSLEAALAGTSAVVAAVAASAAGTLASAVAPVTQQEEEVQKQRQVVHNRVTCDSCETFPIRGNRYKCAICPDYDLCEACELRNVHPADHPMIKLRIPFDEVSVRLERAEDDDEQRRRRHHHHHGHHHHRHPHPHPHPHPHHHRDPRADASPLDQAAASASAVVVEDEKLAKRLAKTEEREAKKEQKAVRRLEKLAAKLEKRTQKAALRAVTAAATAAAVEAPAASAVDLQANFVADVSIPDGTRMCAGTPFTKIWRFRNCGSAAWPATTRLVCTDQSSYFAGPKEVVIGREIAAGEEIDLAVDLVAPEDMAGRFVTFWRLVNNVENGSAFGHRVWVDVTVTEKPVPVVVPPPAAPLLTEAEQVLTSMGFELTLVRTALADARGDLSTAANMLLG